YTDVTATQHVDYPDVADDLLTAVHLPAGQTSVSFDVSFVRDGVYEGDETFQVTLGTVAGVSYGNRVATVTITDIADFPTPQLVPGEPVVVPVDGGTVPFHLAIGQQPAIPVTYHVETRDGTAT